MLVHESRAHAMNLAFDVGLVAAVLSPLTELKGMREGAPAANGLDLWDHAMRVLERLDSNPSFTLAFAALLHDVGKPASLAPGQGGCAVPDHAQTGAGIADRLCRALKLSNAERERITWLVAHHRDLVDARKLRDSTLKEILVEPGIEELLELHRALATASGGDADHVDYCRYYLEVQPAGPINPPPLITGDDLVRHGLAPAASLPRCSRKSARRSSREKFAASARRSNGLTGSSQAKDGRPSSTAGCYRF